MIAEFLKLFEKRSDLRIVWILLQQAANGGGESVNPVGNLVGGVGHNVSPPVNFYQFWQQYILYNFYENWYLGKDSYRKRFLETRCQHG